MRNNLELCIECNIDPFPLMHRGSDALLARIRRSAEGWCGLGRTDLATALMRADIDVYATGTNMTLAQMQSILRANLDKVIAANSIDDEQARANAQTNRCRAPSRPITATLPDK